MYKRQEGFNVDREIEAKSLLVVLTSVANFYVNCFNELIVVFFMLTILDFATGTIAAKIKGEWDKIKAKRGMWEKLGFFVLIFLAATIDYTATLLLQKVSPGTTTKGTFSVATTTWLIGTEGYSNIQNLQEWGVRSIPGFLKRAFKGFQKQSEDISSSNKKNKK